MPRAKTQGAKGRLPKNKKIMDLNGKIEVILYHTKSKCSIRKLAQRFKIGKTQAGAIIRNQDKFVKLWQTNGDGDAKLDKFTSESIGLIIDQRVYQWYEEQVDAGVPVNGTILQSKALEIARELGNEDFKASSAWLDAFKKQYEILFSKVPDGQKNGTESMDAWDKQLVSLSAAFSANDMFCAHETGLFYQAVPDDTSSLKHETCVNGKMAEKRLTILLCTSMTGQKESPLVIIKDQDLKPESESEDLPKYVLESNPMAWMTPEMMSKWITRLDQKMVCENRNICLFLNKTATHQCPKLKNIKVVYFPSHLLGESQPMNLGIIQSFKTHYRLLTLQHLIAQRDKEEDGDESIELINLPKALAWISSAWNGVSQALIERSFKSAGFDCQCADIIQSEGETSLNEVAELLYAYDSDVNAAEYVNIDANLVTEPEDREFLTKAENSVPNSSPSFPSNDKPTKDLDLKSYSEVIKNIKFLEDFFVSREDSVGVSLVHKILEHTESLLGDDDCSS